MPKPLFYRLIIFFPLILFLLPTPSPFSASVEDPEARIEAEKSELKKLKEAIQRDREKIQRLEDHEKSVLETLQGVSRKLDVEKRELRLCGMELTANQEKISKMEKELENIVGMAGHQEAILAGRVRSLYKEGDFSYLKAIFSSENISDLTRRVTYMKAIAEADASLFQKVLEDKEKIEKARAELLLAAQKLESLKNQKEERKKKYQEEKESKDLFLAKIQNEKSLYEKSVREMEDASRSIMDLIQKLETGEKDVPLPEFGGLRLNLPWPVKGEVISAFGKNYNPKYKITTMNQGIVIRSGFLEKVTAVDDGKVLYADWLKGYGQLLIIGHGKGYHSLYGYLDRFLVHVGSSVQKGQVIAEAGDTGSLHGPALYFEIRMKGRPVDPVPWLSAKRGG